MQQSKQNLCMIHLEEIVKKNDNDKGQCKTCMDIQYKNEIIKVEEVKEEQMIMENSKVNIYQQQQKLRKFNYQLLKEFPHNFYRTFVFNQDSTLLFAGRHKVIELFKFKHGKKLLQKITKRTNYVFSLIFMNKTNSLIFQGKNDSIIIWNLNCNNNQKIHETLKGHQKEITIIINNEDEDLIISGSDDEKIEFWRKTNIDWSFQQTIYTNFKVKSLSLNKSQTKLISCGYGSNEILVMELNSTQWNIKQTIQVNYDGRQLCFISDSKFLFQSYKEYLEIYEYQQNERQYIKEKTIGIKKVESYDNIFGYPCKYLESKGFAVIQYGKYLNFFGIDEKQNCELLYSIDFNRNWFIGNISHDGQYLVIINHNYVMQVRKFKQLE